MKVEESDRNGQVLVNYFDFGGNSVECFFTQVTITIQMIRIKDNIYFCLTFSIDTFWFNSLCDAHKIY